MGATPLRSETRKRQHATLHVSAMCYAKMIAAIYRAPITKPALADVTGLSNWSVQRYVDALHLEGVVYISGWLRDGMGRDCTAIYAWGIGVDTPRRSTDKAQRARDYRKRKKAEQQSST